MPQQRIWDDPSRPKLTDFPEEIREAILRRLAKMAARCIRQRTVTKEPADSAEGRDHEQSG